MSISTLYNKATQPLVTVSNRYTIITEPLTPLSKITNINSCPFIMDSAIDALLPNSGNTSSHHR